MAGLVHDGAFGLAGDGGRRGEARTETVASNLGGIEPAAAA